MAKQPRLQRRGSRYFLRVRVPDDIRPIIGKTEIKRALGTSVHREAVDRARVASVEVDGEFALARRKLNGSAGAEAAVNRKPTDAEIRHMVLTWFRAAEERGHAEVAALHTEEREKALEVSRDDEVDLSLGYCDETAASIQQLVNPIFEANGFEPRKVGNREYHLACKLLHRALVELNQRRRDQLTGFATDPQFEALINGHTLAQSALVAPPRAVTLGALIDLYQNDPGRAGLSAATAMAQRVVFRALKELLGAEKPANAITRADCRAVRDLLLRLPPNAAKRFPKLSLREAADRREELGLPALHSTTVRNYLDWLAALFNWAVAEEHLDKNPAARLTVGVPKTSSRKPTFTIEQMKAIFAAPLFVGCRNDGTGYAQPGVERPRRGRFWVPLISLWTGMRLNECCQLLVEDVQTLDGTDCIVIHRSGADDGHEGEIEKRVKTAAGERYVPIHPELKKIGFMRHVAEMRVHGAKRLFPELPRGRNGYFSDPFQKWFGRFLKKAQASRTGTSFHSFRHTYRDALREADVSKERAQALGGWSGSGSADELYGSGLRPSTLAKEIAKLRYDGLDLSHLYVSAEA